MGFVAGLRGTAGGGAFRGPLGDTKGQIYMMGPLPRPGVYELMSGGTTLAQAVVGSGITWGDVEGRTVKIIRREGPTQESTAIVILSDLLAGKVSDRYLQAGDLVALSKDKSMPADEVPVTHTSDTKVDERALSRGDDNQNY